MGDDLVQSVLQWKGLVASNATRSWFPRFSEVIGEGRDREKEIMSVSGNQKGSERTV